MIAHKRNLVFRTERQEKQNRWLTILSGAIIVVVVIVAITAGPSLVRATSDASAYSTTDVGTRSAAQFEN
ncbi:MAG: hypothetical protein HOI35_01195 [Woeseia sp.]|jgi:hypothetical protein|nr:hypothetical protein [Woeseia sp.]